MPATRDDSQKAPRTSPVTASRPREAVRMIQMMGLTKRYGRLTAVDDLTCTVPPGVVTGFLGPNGAGKTTTMRMVLGLDHPTAGTVTVAGRRYADLPAPMYEVGALLDARAVHGSRTAHAHLRCLARSNGIPRRRVDEVLATVGLAAVAGRRTKGFSLGMAQRLGMAAEGRTVLVSSHLMSEMALTADHLVVIGRGRLIADTTTEAFLRANSPRTVRVRVAEDPDRRFAARLAAAGAEVHREADDVLLVSGVDSTAIGGLATASGVVLAELTPQQTSLEEAFMQLTSDSVEFAAGPDRIPEEARR
jgi:ABC-2 type transport system ATP-binding protein